MEEGGGSLFLLPCSGRCSHTCKIESFHRHSRGKGRKEGKPSKSPAPFRAEAEFIANCYFHQVGAKVGEAGEKREVERGKRGQRGGKSGNQLITLGGGGGGGAFNGRRHRLFVLSALEGFFLTKEEKGPDF